jgi:hypothetical protein
MSRRSAQNFLDLLDMERLVLSVSPSSRLL